LENTVLILRAHLGRSLTLHSVVQSGQLAVLRLALVVSMTLVLATNVHAQRRAFVGITGGATVGDLYGGGVNTDARWGGTAGLTAGVRNWDYTVAQIEANWVQKGGEGVRLDYIEIPVLFGGVAQTRSGRSARFYTGVGVAFPIACSADEGSSIACNRDRNVEWALPLGLQLGQWVDAGRFVAIDVRYSIGLSDAFKSFGPNNRSWQFRLMVGRQR
jgi:hypothetical protein